MAVVAAGGGAVVVVVLVVVSLAVAILLFVLCANSRATGAHYRVSTIKQIERERNNTEVSKNTKYKIFFCAVEAGDA
jgi:hypothetical protein